MGQIEMPIVAADLSACICLAAHHGRLILLGMIYVLRIITSAHIAEVTISRSNHIYIHQYE
jgi:hypothetical protein